MPLVAAAAGAAALGGSGRAQTLPNPGLAVALTFGAAPTLAIDGPSVGGLGNASLFGSATPGPPPAQVVVDMPPGYTVSTPPFGAQVGIAVVVSSSSTPETGLGTTLATGVMTADDPAGYSSDPTAQPCSPGTAVAVWKLSTTIVGLGYTLPIFVGHPVGSPQGVELRFCPPPLIGSDGKPLAMPPVRCRRSTCFRCR